MSVIGSVIAHREQGWRCGSCREEGVLVRAGEEKGCGRASSLHDQDKRISNEMTSKHANLQKETGSTVPFGREH